MPRGLGKLGHGAPRWGKVGKSWFLIGSGCWGFGGQNGFEGQESHEEEGDNKKYPSVG